MAILQKCCCCCRLETGGKIFGWLGVVNFILSIIALSILIVNKDEINQNAYEKDMTTKLIIFGIIGVIKFVCAILLIVGTYKRKASLILPWLIEEVISMVLSLVSVYLTSGSANIENFIVTLVIALPLFIYFWLCVLSLYQHLRDTPIIPMTKHLESAPYISSVSNPPPAYYKIEKI